MCFLFHLTEQLNEAVPVSQNDKGKLWWAVNRGDIVLSSTLDCITYTHKDPSEHGGQLAA